MNIEVELVERKFVEKLHYQRQKPPGQSRLAADVVEINKFDVVPDKYRESKPRDTEDTIARHS